jgi:hypothetical protein
MGKGITMAEIRLQEDTLHLLHQWLPFDAGILFPFRQDDSSADGRVEAMLARGGFLSQEGKLTESAREMFSIIAESSSTSKLKFLVEGDLLDYQVFFAKDFSRAVSLKRSEKSFVVSYPAPTVDVLDVISDFSGIGSFGAVPAQWKLSFNESIVLAAIIDLTRRQFFSALAKDDDKIEIGLETTAVIDTAGKNDLNPNWLLWAIKNFLPQECNPKEDELKEAVVSLVEKGLIRKEGKMIISCDQIAISARRLLHLNCLYVLDRFNVNEKNQAEKARVSIIQNGIRDLLLWETDGKSVAWQGISSKVMFTLLEASLCLQNNSPLKEQTGSVCSSSPNQVSTVSTKTAPVFCKKCSNKLKTNARFCNKCGETVK